MKQHNTGASIVALSAVRTPIGRFGGSLKDVAAFELGGIAIHSAIHRSGVLQDHIDEVIFGNCRQAGNGPNPARSAALLGGLDTHVPATTVNMACPSGMKTMFQAAAQLYIGAAHVIVAGGMESMSTIPHMVKGLRFTSRKMGDILIEDGWKDATDPIAGTTMGQTALSIARRYDISRREQDAFALQSHQRATAAMDTGKFANELVPVTLSPKFNHGEVSLERDESPRANTSLDKLGTLPPAFDKDGPVTAGNSSAMSDGACALVLTTADHADALGIPPMFSIRAMAQTAVDGATMGEGPTLSIPMVLNKAGMSLADIDLLEINEAFAAQMVANMRTLHIDPNRLNVHGGAIALGHPTGISGARIVITLAHALRTLDKHTGLAAICGAGGVTTAIIIERC